LYAHLLRQGEAAGARRALNTTPLEHLPALSLVLEPESAVTDLTQAYVEVRYADRRVADEAASELTGQARQVRPKGAAE
jgi:hypothetical protein